MNVVVRGQVKSENSSLPVGVRVSETRVLKLPNNNFHVRSACNSCDLRPILRVAPKGHAVDYSMSWQFGAKHFFSKF